MSSTAAGRPPRAAAGAEERSRRHPCRPRAASRTSLHRRPGGPRPPIRTGCRRRPWRRPGRSWPGRSSRTSPVRIACAHPCSRTLAESALAMGEDPRIDLDQADDHADDRADLAPDERAGWTRRDLVKQGTFAAMAGAVTLAAPACTATSPATSRALRRHPQPARPAAAGRRLDFILDMVQSNPGEPLTQSSFADPRKLAAYGYGGQVVNEWRPPSTAITYDSLHRNVLPAGSDARAWVQRTAAGIDARIEQIHAAGLKALYFTDLIVLPKRLVALYGHQLLDRRGLIDPDRPMTQQLLRVMVAEIFTRFPGLDGLVIRTGETYLQNTPFHTGNDPITRGAHSHLILLGILREEACAKRGKLIVYRTWSFDGFHTDPRYYLAVTDRVAPHPLLVFSIKHTRGDFFRTVPFNPTLAIGRHQQIVEVECQREYEGKGAHPDYVIDGVINGFEELRASPRPIGLADIRDSPNLRGVWTWSRGGGWRGP